MEHNFDLTSVTSLFDVQLSAQSGLVHNVQAAEELLHRYEITTTTNFACIKQNKGFGTTGKKFVNLGTIISLRRAGEAGVSLQES